MRFTPTLRNKLVALQVARLIMISSLCVLLLNGYQKISSHFLLLSHANGLGEIVLQIRQLEESFLLKEAVDFHKYLDSIDLAKSKLENLKDERRRAKSKILIQDMIQELEIYGEDLGILKATLEDGSSSPEIFDDVKIRGEHLSLSMNSLVNAEQNYVERVIRRFAWLLITIIVIATLMALVTSIWLWRKLFLPLRAIAEATNDIAQNNFAPFKVGKADDEINNVFKAINNMSVELERQRESLVEAQKLSSLGTLAAGTAHQLNNPLSNISTSCQIAIEEMENIAGSQFIKDLLKDIEQEVQRAGDTVKGLLEFSRTHQFTLKPVVLKEVTNKVLRLIAGEIPAGIAVEQDIPPKITLLLDSQKMTEALLNLVTNGIQAIAKRPGHVLISAHGVPEEEQVIVKIKDNGKGIAPENLRSIFDPFFSTKNSRDGTGLGLSVAYGIIKKHQGSITVESEIDAGTEFIITLPWPEELQNFLNPNP
ncbi:MAG: HAMP domain-containing sensor histidine kinase [Desulfurivibrionaceae bacterium]